MPLFHYLRRALFLPTLALLTIGTAYRYGGWLGGILAGAAWGLWWGWWLVVSGRWR